MVKEIFINGKLIRNGLFRWLERSWFIFRDSPVLRSSVIKAMSACAVIIAAVFTGIFFWVDRVLGKQLLLWTIPTIFIHTLVVLSNLRFICDNNGEIKKYFQLSNILTSLRIISVVPMLVLLFEDYLAAALAVYCLAALSDVADGYFARRFSQETMMGLMLDPTGDILSTESMFIFLWMRADIPLWLIILLTLRYLQFFGGLALLNILGRRPILHATITGKIVGLIQFFGALVLMCQKVFPSFALGEVINNYLIIVLGLSFTAVIVSQTLIGINTVRGKMETFNTSGGC